MVDIDDPKRGRPDSEFPHINFPTVFADGVVSHVNANGISKFYFQRVEPNMYGSGGAVVTPFMVVAMPTPGFVAMAAFFHQRVQFLISRGDTTQAEWERVLKENVPKIDAAASDAKEKP